MAKILIARHGETDWNSNGRWQGQSDVPLNSTGVKQAENLAHQLTGENIDSVYSSDLGRAFRTAEIVSSHLNLGDVRTDSRLRERHFGKFEGMTTAQIAESMGVEREQVSMLDMDRYPSVEPWDDFLGRIISALDEIHKEAYGDTVLVVAHGGVMRGLHQKFHNGSKPRTFFNNGEVVALEKDGNSWIIRS